MNFWYASGFFFLAIWLFLIAWPAAEVIGKRKTSPYAPIILLSAIACFLLGWYQEGKKSPEAKEEINPPAPRAPVIAPKIELQQFPSPLPSPEIVNEDKLPTVDKHINRTNEPVWVKMLVRHGPREDLYGQPAETAWPIDGYWRYSEIHLSTGRILKPGDWMQGIILRWIWLTPTVCRLTVNDPATNKITTLHLYDSKLDGIERNRLSNYVRPAALGNLPSDKGGISGVPQSVEDLTPSIEPVQNLVEKARAILK